MLPHDTPLGQSLAETLMSRLVVVIKLIDKNDNCFCDAMLLTLMIKMLLLGMQDSSCYVIRLFNYFAIAQRIVIPLKLII